MREEDELLNRTLQRCLREVRRALDADPDVGALATCKAGHVLYIPERSDVNSAMVHWIQVCCTGVCTSILLTFSRILR